MVPLAQEQPLHQERDEETHHCPHSRQNHRGDHISSRQVRNETRQSATEKPGLLRPLHILMVHDEVCLVRLHNTQGVDHPQRIAGAIVHLVLHTVHRLVEHHTQHQNDGARAVGVQLRLDGQRLLVLQ